MKCYIILFKYLTLIFVLFFAHARVNNTQASVEQEQDQDQVRTNRQQGQELMNTNKNSQALEIFEQTSLLQEKIYTVQRDSAANTLQAGFVENQQQRKVEISRKQSEINELKAGNENIDRENYKMIRNTLFFFGTLVGLAVILLLNRFRKLSGLKSRLIASEAQLAETSKMISSGELHKESAKKILSGWNEVSKNLADASPLLLKISNDKQHPFHKQVLQLQATTQSVHSVLTGDEPEEMPEKRPVDLNQMIEEVVSQAYHYTVFEHPDFSCTVVKDLEKILPKVDLVPHDIRYVMFNLLSNAFDAVREKRTNAPKGYDPKVTVSTRKLPRFVQIRVRDNGIGIMEKNPEQVFEAFHSTKNTAKHTGLGLPESKRIITGNYKGELFIESDFTTGTDFIIRFPILTLM
ncbi:MAG: HAMP domain-containing histidine kinase [Bacteroidota bacterium]|nr:HAMP domain-containing histidine kinase [Bacteroidota bacterium]